MRFCAASAAITAAWIVTSVFTVRAVDAFRGLGGAEIVAEMRSGWNPTMIVENVYGPDGVISVVEEYAGKNADWLPVATVNEVGDAVLMDVVPAGWWPVLLCPPRDLHNIIPANPAARDARAELIFADPLGDVVFAGKGWASGSAGVGGGIVCDAFCPPPGLKGDMARILMYMAVLYPSPLWRGSAMVMMVDSPDYPPIFTDYATELLMRWHRADPPDEVELRRDAAIARRQGNSNPFVLYPVLAEYLWGDLQGKVVEGAERPDSPALKARYSISGDVCLGFHSPYIPDGMIWSVDGRRMEAGRDGRTESVALESLGPGRHTVSYRSADSAVNGSLIIEIVP